MKFSLRFLLLLVLLVAMFCGGWVAKTNFDNWNTKDLVMPARTQFVQPHIPVVVNGVVLSTKNQLAAISVGSDDGVNVGETLWFYRDNQYLGTGEIVKTANNMSAVRLHDEQIKPIQIEEGDIAEIRY